MKRIGILLLMSLGSLAFQACKITAPPGAQVADPVKMGEVKALIVVSSGKLYFLEDKAVYKPNALGYTRKVKEFQYSEIDSVAKHRFLGILPLTAIIKMKDGKKFRLSSYKRKYVVKTLNSLKH